MLQAKQRISPDQRQRHNISTKPDIKEICKNVKACHFSHYNFLFGKYSYF